MAKKKTTKKANTNGHEPLEPGRVYTLSLDRIHPNPLNRKRAAHTNDAYLDELAGQIADPAIGQIHAGIARPHPDNPGDADLIIGRCRFLACQRADNNPMRVEVRDLTDGQCRELIAIENLTRKDPEPWEVAVALRDLLDQYDNDFSRVADRIRRDPRWVAKHAVLADLEQKWLDEWAKPEEYEDDSDLPFLKSSPVTAFTTGHMLLIARMPQSARDELWKDIGPQSGRRQWTPDGLNVDEWGGLTVEQLRRAIAHHYTLLLEAARWSLDDEKLVKKAGACSACPKRTGCKPGLFDDLAESRPGDRCLDRTCWNRKLAAHIKASVKAAEADTGKKAKKLSTKYYGFEEDEESASKYDETTKEKGEPAVMVDGPRAGETIYVKQSRSSYSGNAGSNGISNGKVTGTPTPLKERRENLQVKRWRKVIGRLVTLIEGPDGQRWEKGDVDKLAKPPAEDVLRLAAHYGTGLAHRYDSTRNTKDLRELFQQKMTPAKLAEILWQQVRLQVTVDIRLYHQERYASLKKTSKEAELLAGILLGDDWWSEQIDLVKEEIPEPKSWAKLNADGTPKKKATTKKAASKTGKKKAKAKA